MATEVEVLVGGTGVAVMVGRAREVGVLVGGMGVGIGAMGAEGKRPMLLLQPVKLKTKPRTTKEIKPQARSLETSFFHDFIIIALLVALVPHEYSDFEARFIPGYRKKVVGQFE